MIQPLLGLIGLPLIAFLLSENKRAVKIKPIIIGISTQILIAALFLKVPLLKDVISWLNGGVILIQEVTTEATSFLFGYLSGGPLPFAETTPGGSFIVAFRILPLILVMSALSAVLFHWRILPFIINIFSRFLKKAFNLSGAASFGAAAGVFLGIVEGPIIIRPYLSKMSRADLFIIMSVGMATVAGTVMVLYASILSQSIPDAIGHILIASVISVPASITLARIIVPEGLTVDSSPIIKSQHKNTMDALVTGTSEGIAMILNIVAMIIVLFACVHLINRGLALITINGSALSLQSFFGYLLTPVIWLMGVSWDNIDSARNLMGTKLVLNEFVAYLNLAKIAPELLSDRNRVILIYGMCGFANFASLGLLIGAFKTLIPERNDDVLDLGWRSVIVGMLASAMTAACVAIIL